MLDEKLKSNLSSGLYEKSILDTILIDSILFSNSINNPTHLSVIIAKWKESVTNPKLYDAIPRSSEEQISKRLGNIITMLLNFRNISKSDIKEYTSFLQSYYFMRQVFDDLADYDEDLAMNVESYAVTRGKRLTKAMITKHENIVKSLNIPLFYKNVFTFYTRHYNK